MVVGAIGTKDMCEWIKKTLNCGGSVIRRNDCKNTVYRYIASHNNAIKIIDMLNNILELKDIKIFRKWNKIYEYKLYCSNM